MFFKKYGAMKMARASHKANVGFVMESMIKFGENRARGMRQKARK
jgi:hypothetical protein